MDPQDALLTILGLGAITLLSRAFFLLPRHELPMPPLVRRALKYAPLAALVAIIVPEVVLTRGALIGTCPSTSRRSPAIASDSYSMSRWVCS